MRREPPAFNVTPLDRVGTAAWMIWARRGDELDVLLRGVTPQACPDQVLWTAIDAS